MQVTLAADGERDRQTEKRKKMKKQRNERKWKDRETKENEKTEKRKKMKKQRNERKWKDRETNAKKVSCHAMSKTCWRTFPFSFLPFFSFHFCLSNVLSCTYSGCNLQFTSNLSNNERQNNPAHTLRTAESNKTWGPLTVGTYMYVCKVP
jgi:hypothetical protein